LVLCVGEHTIAGKADRALSIQNEITPLQAKLERIADQVGTLGLTCAILTFSALVLRHAAQLYMRGDDWLSFENLTFLIDSFIVAVTIVVVAVPEGLPLAVTLSLAFSVSKMFKEHNLVRRLHASETMGGANEICSDKTGTLTLNKMTVQALYAGGKVYEGDKNCKLLTVPIGLTLAEAAIYNS
jgi:magnesium-transporting ATPase (P-type)